jgi:hypothetical protein
MEKLPSEFQMGETLHLAFWAGSNQCEVIAIQFVKAKDVLKALYDVDIVASDGGISRIHRIEEKMLKRYYKNGVYSN